MKHNLTDINSEKELQEIINSTEGILILDFTSPICPPCLMLEPVLEELVESKMCSVAKINVFENQELSQKYEVSATPTLFILKNKEVVKKVLGYQPAEVWVQMLKEI